MNDRHSELLAKAIMLPFALVFVLAQGLWRIVISFFRIVRRLATLWSVRARKKRIKRLRTPNYNPFDEKYNQHMDPYIIDMANRMEAENEAIKESVLNEIKQEKMNRSIRNMWNK